MRREQARLTYTNQFFFLDCLFLFLRVLLLPSEELSGGIGEEQEEDEEEVRSGEAMQHSSVATTNSSSDCR